MNWGVVENAAEDAGNALDLLLFARRPAADPQPGKEFEEFGMAGGQVKSWRRKRTRRPRSRGWSYGYRRAVLEAWTDGPLPTVLFLYDPEVQSAWWVEVTRAAATIDGDRFSILVPQANLLTEASTIQLADIIERANERAGGYVGSAWKVPGQTKPLPLAEQRRRALLVPRLIAPHPNAIRSGVLGPAEALALVAAGRIEELLFRARRPPGADGSLETLRSHPDWDWRLVGGLAAALDGDHKPAVQLIAAAPDIPARSAACVIAVATVAGAGNVPEALRILDQHSHDASGFDAAWLAAQRGRLQLELGRSDAARAALSAAALTLAGDSQPYSAAVLAGVLITRLALMPNVSTALPTLIAGTDNHAAWWAAVAHSQVLERVVDDEFAVAYPQPGTHWFFEDVIQGRLMSNCLIANLSANQGWWKSELRVLGRLTVLRAQNDRDVGLGLERLRQSGDHEATGLVARSLVNHGDHQVVLDLFRDFSGPGWWTRTNAHATWVLLAQTAPVLGEAAASTLVQFCLDSLQGKPSAALANLGDRGYFRSREVMRTLAAVLPAAEQNAIREAANWLLNRVLEGGLTAVEAQDMDSLVADIPAAAMAPRVEQWVAWACATENRGAVAVLGRLAREGLQTAAAELRRRALAGSLDALAWLWDQFPAGTVGVLTQAVQARIAEADAMQRSSYSGPSPTSYLVRALSVGSSSEEDWRPLVRLLVHPAVSPKDKTEALTALWSQREAVPQRIRERIAGSIDDLTAPDPLPDFDEDDQPTEISLAPLALGLEDPGSCDYSALTRMALSKSSVDRVSAAIILGSYKPLAESRDLLFLLAVDKEPVVRGPAIRLLVRRALTDVETGSLLATVLPFSDVPTARSAASELAGAQGLNEPLRRVRETLAGHPHAGVRQALRGGL
jgi:hypothetical protein